MIEMVVEDVLWAEGRGLVCTGRAPYPFPKVGTMITVLRQEMRDPLSFQCVGVERFAMLYSAKEIGPVGIVLKGARLQDINPGDKLVF